MKYFKRVAAGVPMSALLAASALCAPALAQPPAGAVASAIQTYNIAPGPAAQVLLQIGQQSGVAVVFDSKTTDGKRSRGVTGRMTLNAAVRVALKGTGLEPVLGPDGVVTIHPASQVRAALSAEHAPPPRRSTPATDDSERADSDATPAPAVVVIARAYAAQSTNSATRTDTPLQDIPQSIEIVSQAVMQSQQAQTVADALQNVSGVSLDGNGTPYIRGFQATVSVGGLTDNTSLNSPLGGIDIPIVGVQQVEVLKGPDSILAGSTSPGGVVNVVMKPPTATPDRELAFQGGSYGDERLDATLAGPIAPEHDDLSFRIIASEEHADTNFGGYDGLQTYYAYAAVGWKTNNTNLVVSTDYTDRRDPVAPYTALFNGSPVNLTRPISNPADNTLLRGVEVNYDLIQHLGGSWSFHSKASYGVGELDTDYYSLFILSFPDAEYIPQVDTLKVSGFNTDNNITRTVELGPVKQTLLAGYSYQQEHAQQSQVESGGEVLSIFQPPVNRARSAPSFGTFNEDEGISDSSQLYFQDQIAYGHLHILVNVADAGAKSMFYNESRWIPSIGAVYEVVKGVSLFASDTNSFQVQPAEPLVDGKLAPPSTGQQYEVGVKLDYFEHKFRGTLSVFQTKSADAEIFDPGAGGFVLQPGGEAQGVEGDIQGQPIRGLNLIGSYTYTKFIPESINFSQVPRNQFSLWATYELQDGPAQGLGFGGGVFARSNYEAEDATGVMSSVPAQARLDLTLYYKWKQYTARLGVKNVTGAKLYADFANDGTVEQQAGRNVLVTLSAAF
jgi:iron complex outermembrane receptor protein